MNETIEARGHTTGDGMLNLSVAVVVQVRVLPRVVDRDENGWPKNFFEQVAGSMPRLRRGPQGQFEERLPFE
jgi:hypothetical protein